MSKFEKFLLSCVVAAGIILFVLLNDIWVVIVVSVVIAIAVATFEPWSYDGPVDRDDCDPEY